MSSHSASSIADSRLKSYSPPAAEVERLRYSWARALLERLRSEGLDRELTVCGCSGSFMVVNGRRCLNLSSNDYLGLSAHPTVVEAAATATRRSGASASSSRLVSGTLREHSEFDSALAQFFGYEAGLALGSGLHANLAILTALVEAGDTLLLDRLSHATLIDGALLSRAKLQRYRHNDLDHLEQLLRRAELGSAGKRIVVTESVFSMDGDLAPLKEVVELSQRYRALLIVDEAHALGVFGPHGSGRVAEAGLTQQVDVCSGGFGKGGGSFGGMIVCAPLLRDLLVHRARSLIYSTALPPGVVAANLAVLSLLRAQAGWGEEVLLRAERFREQLRAGGLRVGASRSQIVPLLIGDNERTKLFSKRLFEEGIYAVAIRSPTVPSGSERIRFSIGRALSEEELTKVAEIAIAIGEELQVTV